MAGINRREGLIHVRPAAGVRAHLREEMIDGRAVLGREPKRARVRRLTGFEAREARVESHVIPLTHFGGVDCLGRF